MPDNRKPLIYGAFPVCRNYTVRAQLRSCFHQKWGRHQNRAGKPRPRHSGVYAGRLRPRNKPDEEGQRRPDGAVHQKPARKRTRRLIFLLKRLILFAQHKKYIFNEPIPASVRIFYTARLKIRLNFCFWAKKNLETIAASRFLSGKQHPFRFPDLKSLEISRVFAFPASHNKSISKL